MKRAKTVIKNIAQLWYFLLNGSLNRRHYEDFQSINALTDIITIPHTVTFEDINGHIIKHGDLPNISDYVPTTFMTQR